MGFIDADTHVVECAATWEYLDPGLEEYRPLAVTTDLRGGAAFWQVGDQRQRRGLGSEAMPAALRDLSDVPGRVVAMDALGVDIQVLHPTFFLMVNLSRPDVQLALTRSYNRWMADRWSQAPDRFRWTMVPPLLRPDLLESELRFARDNGACGVLLRGAEYYRPLSDPWFDPLYAVAQDLDMAIAVHVGSIAPAQDAAIFASRQAPPGYNVFTILPNVAGFYSLLVGSVAERFPRLRFGFLESGAQWISFCLREAARARPLPDQPLKAKNLYVACQITDDIPYVLADAGPDRLVIGTDYGHADIGSDLTAHREIVARTDIDPAAARAIVNDNARALFALPA